MTIEVQIISAPWCKRCQIIKPDIAEHCRLSGATLSLVEYDDLEEAEQAIIKSLPTIRLRLEPTNEWTTYTADTIADFKTVLIREAIATTDF